MHLRRMNELYRTLWDFRNGDWVPDEEFGRIKPTEFDLGSWVSARWCTPTGELLLAPTAPVSACAVGIAMFTPIFNEQGFRYNPFHSVPVYNGAAGFRAVCNYFNLPFIQAVYLFQHGSYNKDEPDVFLEILIRLSDAICYEEAKWHRRWSVTKRLHEWFEK